jgi:hypothetical protein
LFGLAAANSRKIEEYELNYHPNKHINAAIEYAIGRGWALKKAGARAHIWGSLFCPHGDRGGCRISVFSTPRVPENHARWIRRLVDRCEHSS